MLAVETELKNAQKIKEFLYKHKLINGDYLPVKEMGYIYFPLLKKAKVPGSKVIETKFEFPLKEKPLTVEELLKLKLTKEEMAILPKSQEIVGKILILEIPREMQSKEKVIAEAYLKANQQVETVVRKEDVHSGDFRLRKVRFLAGKNTKETTHYENGVQIKLHLEKTYFSARSGHERLRIAQLVKPGENVLVMFSGAAPYPLVIARNSEADKIYGIEWNPQAHIYGVENVDLNNFRERIILFDGDVWEVLPKLKEKFDRIIMPLPKTGEEFLPLALPKVKSGGVIHLYGFMDVKEIPGHARLIKKICQEIGYNVRILRKVKCGQFSPGTFRVCFDIKVS